MDVTISLKMAEDIVRLFPNISQLDRDERKVFYKFCSVINQALSTPEFRPMPGSDSSMSHHGVTK